MKALSLFANIGVAEAYLEETGIDVVLANEVDVKRAAIYRHLYPDTEMVCGDIAKKDVFDYLVKRSLEKRVDVILATPPCQGMSSAGKQESGDDRNVLVTHAVSAIRMIRPKYALLENVPRQMVTTIWNDEAWQGIPEYVEKELGDDYIIVRGVLNACKYGVPQSRERAIFVMTRKTAGRGDEGEDARTHPTWEFPEKLERVVTLHDAIGHLPILDPYVKDATPKMRKKLFPEFEERERLAREYSKWHVPPVHVYRQVLAMTYTPTGCSAFDNKVYYPRKLDGRPVRGYKNTYKRQRWDMPASTVTMYNRTISSQNNVHPGRPMGRDKNGDEKYSDARVLTLYELLLIMSLPVDWNLPDGYSWAYLRSVIGEGIPPLLVKQIFTRIANQ